MYVENKFAVGQAVFVVEDGVELPHMLAGRITKVSVEIDEAGTRIEYRVKVGSTTQFFEESSIFSSEFSAATALRRATFPEEFEPSAAQTLDHEEIVT